MFPVAEYPFEWAGLYACEPGGYVLEVRRGPAPTLSIIVLRVEADHTEGILETTEQASRLFSARPVDRVSGQVVLSGALHQRLVLKKHESTHFHVLLPTGGRYVLFTQHLPQELNLTLTGPVMIGERHFARPQVHRDCVSRVRLNVETPLHAVKFHQWLERLLQGQAGDLLRIKGCLNFAGSPDLIVIQGGHGSIDTRALKPWGDRARATQLVLVGRGLDRRELLWRLLGCCV